MDNLFNFKQITHIPNSNIFVQYRDEDKNILDTPIDFIGLDRDGSPVLLEFDGIGNFCRAGEYPNTETNEKFWGIVRK